MKQVSEKLLKKRKFLLVLPVLVVPFLTLICWALGLGSVNVEARQQKTGLNSELPEARVSGDGLDKLSLYNEAEQDSLDRKQAISMDPFAGPDSLPQAGDEDSMPPLGYSTPSTSAGAKNNSGTYRAYGTYDANEMKVRDRLAALERSLSAPVSSNTADNNAVREMEDSPLGQDMKKLEQMMSSLSSNGDQDPEVGQLSDLMEKVLDVQYPGRALQKIKERSQKSKGRIFPIAPMPQSTTASLMKMPSRAPRAKLVDSTDIPVYEPLSQQNGFYGLRDETVTDQPLTAIPAVIHETRTVVAGAVVKLRLTEDIMISGMQIPAGNFINGYCSISGERLLISIPELRYQKHILPVSLKVHDLDGLEGISVPGSISRDAAKDGAGQVVQSMQFMNLDPSLAAQAAGAGVEVAKGLFSKKTKLIRVTVKAGYPVLLLDDKARLDTE